MAASAPNAAWSIPNYLGTGQRRVFPSNAHVDAVICAVAGIPPQRWGRHLVAFLQLYADASGDPKRERDPYFVLGGYTAPAAEWIELSAKWHDTLTKYGMDWFHMTDVESRKKKPYASWDDAKRHECVSEFATLIRNHVDKALSVYADMRVWREYRDLLVPFNQLKNDLGKVYDPMFGTMLSYVEGLCDYAGLDYSEVDSFFAVPNELSQFGREEIKRLFLRRGFSEPSFKLSADFAALQAADMCAWLVREQLEHPDAPEEPRHVGILKHHFSTPIPDDFIRKLTDNVRARLPDLERAEQRKREQPGRKRRRRK